MYKKHSLILLLFPIHLKEIYNASDNDQIISSGFRLQKEDFRTQVPVLSLSSRQTSSNCR